MAEFVNGRIVLHVKIGLHKLIESKLITNILVDKPDGVNFRATVYVPAADGNNVIVMGTGKTVLEAIEALNKEIVAMNFEL